MLTKEQFNRLKPANKRIAIATDVIAQLESKKFKAEEGTYVNIDTPKKKNSRTQLQKLVRDRVSTCHVCAKGALFMSHIKIKNHFTVGKLEKAEDDLETGNEIKNTLKGYFSEEQLDSMEAAFECHWSPFNSWFHNSALNFGRQYKKPEKRLVAIMQNLIENKGKFKP